MAVRRHDEFAELLHPRRPLADADTVYTKAGWINGEGDLYALNDAGLVMSQSGTYVLAVLTNACGRNDLLTSLIGTLDAVHSGDMRG